MSKKKLNKRWKKVVRGNPFMKLPSKEEQAKMLTPIFRSVDSFK